MLITKGARQRLDPPPTQVIENHPGASVAELLVAHQARLRQLRNVRAVILDDVAQRQMLLDNTQYLCEYERAREVFVPLTNAELERLTAAKAEGK